MFKALREAKVSVSWINSRPEYDAAVHRFLAAILDRSSANPFLDDFLPFQRTVAAWGMLNSLSQTLLKLTVPGVPDFYQGTELWDLSLVDPDNRRPVDFGRRRWLLEALDSEIQASGDLSAFARALLDAWEDGRVKMYVIRRTLGFRRDHAALFQRGDYRPLGLAGSLAGHACAFARVLGTEAVLTLVPRLVARRGLEGPPLGRAWWGDDTRVPIAQAIGRRFCNVLTNERVRVHDSALALAEVFRTFPVALLVRED